MHTGGLWAFRQGLAWLTILVVVEAGDVAVVRVIRVEPRFQCQRRGWCTERNQSVGNGADRVRGLMFGRVGSWESGS